MTIFVFETPESRKRRGSNDDNSNTATLQYGCYGTTDDQSAGDAIVAVAPVTFRGLEQKTLDLTPLGGDIWMASLEYVNANNQKEKDRTNEVDEWKISFSGGDQTQLVKFAEAGSTTSYPSEAPDYKGAIGVDVSDGKITVQGLEVPIAGGTELTIHFRKAKASITTEYVDLLDSLRGKKNDATFFGFARGRLLFLKADGTDASRGDPEVDFRFLIDVDQNGLAFGDITGVDKPAHDVLDIVWDYDTDDEAKVLVPTPLAVYVHEIHKEADFEDLGIGTGV